MVVIVAVMRMMRTNSNNSHILLAVVVIATHVVSLAMFQLIKHLMDNTMNTVKVVTHTYPCHYLVDIHIVRNFKQQR